MNVTIWLIQVNLTYPEEFSENLRSFLGGLIQKNPEERMSIEEVLAHPFIRDIKLVKLNWLKDTRLKKLKYTLADWFKNDLLLEFFIYHIFYYSERILYRMNIILENSLWDYKYQWIMIHEEDFFLFW